MSGEPLNMTPAETAVAMDMLLGCKCNGVALSRETVERMLNHVNPDMQRDMCIRTAVRVRSAAARLVVAGSVDEIRLRIERLDCGPHVPPFGVEGVKPFTTIIDEMLRNS